MMLDLGLLLLRVSFGGLLLFCHGWPKLMNFSGIAPTFPNPYGLGPQLSLGLAVFAEVFCSALVMLGVATRLAAIPPSVTMATALLIIHSSDTYDVKEPSLLYLIPFLVLILTGSGKWSLDSLLTARR
jgi:putative oxidoreductase